MTATCDGCGPDCACCIACRAFAAWTAEHDPDDEMDLLDQIEAYGRWNSEHQPKQEPTP